jgi:cytoskeleton protein RodZ
VPAPEDTGSAPLPTGIVAQGESNPADTTTRTDEVIAQAREALAQSRQSIASSTPATAAQEPAQEQSQSVPDAPDSEQRAPQDSAPLATASAEQISAQDALPPSAVSEDRLIQDTNLPPPSTTGQMHLELKFAEEAWVEIYDRDDNRLFYDLAKPGQTADLRGTAPLRILLGRARGVEVQVDGKPFDVTQFVEKGMARFTLP